MEIFYDIKDTMIVPECAATIGVFDGVHAGHRQVIKQMMDEAQQHGYKSMVITFDKLPQQLFVPGFQAQHSFLQEIVDPVSYNQGNKLHKNLCR